MFPVVSLGDVMGGVLLLKGEKAPARVSQEAVESARAAACSSRGSWRRENPGISGRKSQKALIFREGGAIITMVIVG